MSKEDAVVANEGAEPTSVAATAEGGSATAGGAVKAAANRRKTAKLKKQEKNGKRMEGIVMTVSAKRVLSARVDSGCQTSGNGSNC